MEVAKDILNITCGSGRSFLPHDYSYLLTKKEVLVCLDDRHGFYPDLKDRIEEFADRYGFTFHNGVSILERSESNHFRLIHTIVVDGLDCVSSALRKHKKTISLSSSATLAMSYSSKEAFNNAAEIINTIKRKKTAINFLRPNLCGTEGYRPSLDKLVDNSVCDSIRIKYRPIKKTSHNIQLPSGIASFFENVSLAFSEFSLYHRSPTDGFISVKGDDGLIYITCTKTNKVNIDLERVSIIHNYDMLTNSLTYEGSFLPSSDSVETAIMYSELTDVKSIIHTHASQRYTRNPKYVHRYAVPPSRYGEPELGIKVSQFVKQNSMYDFVIMEDHGELFFSRECSVIDRMKEFNSTLTKNQ